VDQNVDEDPDRWVQACCFLCSNGCGIDIGVKGDQPGGFVRPYVNRHGERREGEPEALDQALLVERSQSAFGLLRDLQDLWLMANENTISVAVLLQGARALGDRDLEKGLQGVENRNEHQRTWLLTRIRQAAPQTLSVPS